MNGPSVWKQRSQGTDLTFSLSLVMVYFLLKVELSKRFPLELFSWMRGFILGEVQSLGGGIMQTEPFFFFVHSTVVNMIISTPHSKSWRNNIPPFGNLY